MHGALELLLAAAHRRQRARARVLVADVAVVTVSLPRRRSSSPLASCAGRATSGVTSRRDGAPRSAPTGAAWRRVLRPRRRPPVRAAARGGALLPRRGGALRPRSAGALPPRPGGGRSRRARACGALPPRRGAWPPRRRAGAPRPRGPSSLRARGGALPSRRSTSSFSTTPERSAARPGGGFGASCHTAGAAATGGRLRLEHGDSRRGVRLRRRAWRTCASWSRRRPLGAAMREILAHRALLDAGPLQRQGLLGVDAQRLVVAGFRIAHSVSSAAVSSSAIAANIAWSSGEPPR